MSTPNSVHNTHVNSKHGDDYVEDPDPITRISKLDVSDPLHLHPNDSSILIVVSIKLKGTKNNQVWSCAMLLALEGKNKTGFIDGSCKRSKTDEILGRHWDREELKETYDKVDGSIIFGLHHQIHTLKQNGSSIADYYHKLNALWKQYDAMIELPKCVCNASKGFKKHNQLMKLMQFLMGLDDSYMQIRSSILSREVLPNVKSAYATISIEESYRVASSRVSVHLLDFSNEQMATLLSLIKDNKTGKNVQANMARLVNYGKIIDSGANQHITYTDKDLDNVLDIFHLKIKVGHPNGTEAFILKIGNLRLSNRLTLYDVMVIPEYCVTLISVHKMAKENKIFVVFDESKCYFVNQDLNLKSVLGTSDQCEGLYYYNDQGARVNKNNLSFQCLLSQYDWHCRLSHPTKPVKNVLKKSLTFDKPDKDLCCEIPYVLGGIPLRMWSESILTATYVINRLPSSVSASSSSSKSGGIFVTADFPVNSRNDVDSSDNNFATQDEGVTTLEENVFSKGNMDQNPNSISQDNQNLRRSSRQSVFPKNYNDFVVDSKVKYGIEKYVGYSKLNSENYCFITQLNKNIKPKSFFEASKFPHWVDAMNQEMNALLRNITWDIVELPKDRKAIGSKWIYKIKYQSSGEIDRFKARLVAQGFSQKEGIDYEETFSPMVKMVTVRYEIVYMRPPEGYFPSGNKVCKLKKSLYGLKQAPRQWNAKLTSTLTENGFSQSKKYVSDLLSEYGMLACKPVDTPLLSKLVISNEATESDPVLDNITDYQKLMGKLIYLTNTRPDISYVVHCLSQFMHSPLKSHLKATFKILRYLKGCPGLEIHFVKTSGMFLSAFSYADWAKCVITRKSVTVDYRALASVTSEVIWILKFLKDLKIENLLPVNLHCDSNSAIKIAANLVFHERTKHLEIDLHFVRENFLKGFVKTVKVDSANQIANQTVKVDSTKHLEIDLHFLVEVPYDNRNKFLAPLLGE
ncbi:ribonuclease H-like domain-containing protein [Tanacetum coccineum]